MVTKLRAFFHFFSTIQHQLALIRPFFDPLFRVLPPHMIPFWNQHTQPCNIKLEMSGKCNFLKIIIFSPCSRPELSRENSRNRDWAFSPVPPAECLESLQQHKIDMCSSAAIHKRLTRYIWWSSAPVFSQNDDYDISRWQLLKTWQPSQRGLSGPKAGGFHVRQDYKKESGEILA